MASVPAIHDKAPKPPGLLPKNVQSWLLVGLAVLMVLIMWLTSGKKPVAPSKPLPPSPSVLPPLEVNEAKIVELQKRIEDLQREQAVAQSALAQQNRVLAQTADAPLAQPAATANGSVTDRPEEAIQAERKKREYLSLFSSNVALSYRKGQASSPREEGQTAPAPATDLSTAQLTELLKPLQPAAVPAVALKPSAEENRKEENRSSVAAPAGAPATAT